MTYGTPKNTDISEIKEFTRFLGKGKRIGEVTVSHGNVTTALGDASMFISTFSGQGDHSRMYFIIEARQNDEGVYGKITETNEARPLNKE